MSEDPIIRAAYNPDTGTIPCVLLQAGYGGDRRACQQFDANDWSTSPSERSVMIEAPLSQWRQVSKMSREERIEKFGGLLR